MVEVLFHSFLTSAVGGDELLISRLHHFILRKLPRYAMNRRGHTAVQLVVALRYKPEGRGFDWNSSLIEVGLVTVLWST